MRNVTKIRKKRNTWLLSLYSYNGVITWIHRSLLHILARLYNSRKKLKNLSLLSVLVLVFRYCKKDDVLCPQTACHTAWGGCYVWCTRKTMAMISPQHSTQTWHWILFVHVEDSSLALIFTDRLGKMPLSNILGHTNEMNMSLCQNYVWWHTPSVFVYNLVQLNPELSIYGTPNEIGITLRHRLEFSFRSLLRCVGYYCPLCKSRHGSTSRSLLPLINKRGGIHPVLCL